MAGELWPGENAKQLWPGEKTDRWPGENEPPSESAGAHVKDVFARGAEAAIGGIKEIAKGVGQLGGDLSDASAGTNTSQKFADPGAGFGVERTAEGGLIRHGKPVGMRLRPGVEDIAAGGLGLQGGVMQAVTSPLTAANPMIERNTGIPTSVTDVVAPMALPFGIYAGGRGVARLTPETVRPKAPTLAGLTAKGEGAPGVGNVAARGNSSAAQKLASINQVLEDAAKKPWSDRQDAIRQGVAAILGDPEKAALYSDEQREQMARIVKGTKTGNIANWLGDTFGVEPGDVKNHLLAALATGGPSLSHAVKTLPFTLTAGRVGEAVGLGSTRRQGNILQDIIARESPLARSRKPTANPVREFLDKLFPPFGGRPKPDYRLGGGGSAGVPPGPEAPGVGVEQRNVHGLEPALRVAVPTAAVPDKPLFTAATNNKNAAAQIANLDVIAQAFPSPGRSADAWSDMMAYALGSRDVPIPPYNLFADMNEGRAVAKLSKLTPGQIAEGDHGAANAKVILDMLTSGEMRPEHTGKLFLWGFMSRRLSPYVQEASFLDAFHGIEPWVERSLAGQFTEADIPAYKAWVDTVLQKGSGLPGVGAKNNMWDFGTFLEKMGQPMEEGGPTRLQIMHELLADPTKTGPQIRREFAKMSEGVGMDNKIMSFILLVSGRDDVMILDRVQFDGLWNDGRFGERNLYEGEKVKSKTSGKSQTKTGTSIAELGNGVRGLVVYEALEREIGARVLEIYTQLGRAQSASIGRYHWDTWNAHSGQEASHGSLKAIIRDVRGENAPAANILSKQGEYGAYEYGAQYGRDEGGVPFFRYRTPLYGNLYEFTVPAFRDFIEAVKTPKTGVVPTGFKVTEAGNGPWYRHPRVSQRRLDETAARFADRSGGRPSEPEAGEAAHGNEVADGTGPGARGQQGTVGLGAVAPVQPLMRQVLERGRSGRPTATEPIGKTSAQPENVISLGQKKVERASRVEGSIDRPAMKQAILQLGGLPQSDIDQIIEHAITAAKRYGSAKAAAEATRMESTFWDKRYRAALEAME